MGNQNLKHLKLKLISIFFITFIGCQNRKLNHIEYFYNQAEECNLLRNKKDVTIYEYKDLVYLTTPYWKGFGFAFKYGDYIFTDTKNIKSKQELIKVNNYVFENPLFVSNSFYISEVELLTDSVKVYYYKKNNSLEVKDTTFVVNVK